VIIQQAMGLPCALLLADTGPLKYTLVTITGAIEPTAISATARPNKPDRLVYIGAIDSGDLTTLESNVESPTVRPASGDRTTLESIVAPDSIISSYRQIDLILCKNSVIPLSHTMNRKYSGDLVHPSRALIGNCCKKGHHVAQSRLLQDHTMICTILCDVALIELKSVIVIQVSGRAPSEDAVLCDVRTSDFHGRDTYHKLTNTRHRLARSAVICGNSL
jgi:hypothetical protein